MRLFNRIYRKLYFKFGEFFIPTQKIDIPDFLKNKKNVFIYFDYEREFGGHSTNISDKNIIEILAILDKFRAKTTWFTVGEIFKLYPESIKAIIDNGHEIGSHTHSHTPPFEMTNKKIKSDSELFTQSSNLYYPVKGFHSPNGQWNFKMFKSLCKQGIVYDISGDTKKNNGIPFYIHHCKKNSIVRMKTAGDDWPLYVVSHSENEVFEYLSNLTKKINTGTISGIGFHPWVLFSNQNILNGFIRFLDFLNKQDDFVINPAIDFIEQIRKNQII